MLQHSKRLGSIFNTFNRVTRSFSGYDYKGNGVLGVVKEDFSMWERRCPLCPHHVQELKNQGIKVIIQPCTRRVFSDQEFREAGAIVQEDLSEASLIIGVKRIPLSLINGGKNYLFFSHVIKAQPYNMDLLDHILETKARLFDYECITKDGKDSGVRLVAFGKFAGIAGMIDGLQGFGQRLLAEGFSTPFLNIPTSHMYQNLDQARYTVRNVGAQIAHGALPESLTPVVFAFTGTGNVSNGAREIFELLPHEYIKVSDLPSLASDVASGKKKGNKIYGVVLTAEQLVRRKDGSNLPFDKSHYYSQPELYESRFYDDVLPYVSFLANCMYWDRRFPRIITNEEIKKMRSTGNKNLRFVSDISCDPNGSVEFMTHCTEIQQPFFTYVPETGAEVVNVSKDGVSINSVEILPTELPRDASEHFGRALMPLLPPLLKSKGSVDHNDMNDVPAELRRACIASHGALLPKWNYISRLREQTTRKLPENTSGADEETTAVVQMTGHLFDSGVINKVFDEVEKSGVTFSITNKDVRSNTTSGSKKSRIEMSMTGPKDKIHASCKRVQDIVESEPAADGKVNVMLHGYSSEMTSAEIRVTSPQRVVLLGAGRVAEPVLKLLAQHENVHITVASDNETQARNLMSCIHPSKTSYRQLIMPRDNDKIDALVKDSDVVISLLPATMHIPVAKAAINRGRNLVTASYVSEDMRQLNDAAVNAGVILMNEVGLDPGIDHMLIMKAVDSIHERGGVVEELISLCGGLPDPVAADNPLRYKFSWSPRGVLNASGNAATHLLNGVVEHIEGKDLLKSAKPSTRFPTMRLEAYPNRDSLYYRDFYNVPNVHTICRGTLRYEGWANAMYALRVLNLFSVVPHNCKTWDELIAKGTGSGSSSKQAVIAAFTRNGVIDVEGAVTAVEWLELRSKMKLEGATPIEALCTLLEKRLTFGENERDMVAMYHTVNGRMPDGTMEHHTSRLLAFGTPGGDSAMSTTVGYTTAAAAELLLAGKIRRKGVVIPTTSDIYTPILNRLGDFGITWSEEVTYHKK